MMDDFKPSKRSTAVGGVNDGPYMPPHMQPGAQGADTFIPGGTVGIQNNQIPKTYEEISNTPSTPDPYCTAGPNEPCNSRSVGLPWTPQTAFSRQPHPPFTMDAV
jgi:hypothetical protein